MRYQLDLTLRQAEGALARVLGTAERRGKSPHQRDANLHSRQKTVGILSQIESDFRGAIPFFGALLQTAATGREDGDLRSGKKAVGENQHQDD